MANFEIKSIISKESHGDFKQCILRVKRIIYSKSLIPLSITHNIFIKHLFRMS